MDGERGEGEEITVRQASIATPIVIKGNFKLNQLVKSVQSHKECCQ